MALRAGESVLVLVTLDLPRGATVGPVSVTIAGRELVGASPAYAPAVYLRPRPRPWGRTRTGSAWTDYRAAQEWLLEPTALPPGPHPFAARLHVPADAVPTYGGSNVIVEHELCAVAMVDGRRLEAWRPLHVWAARSEAPDLDPVVLTAPRPPKNPLERLLAPLRAGVRLKVGVPSTVELHQPLAGWFELENPDERPVRRLELELFGVETSRHRAATDVVEYSAARHEILLPVRPYLRDEFRWALPATVAPTLRSRRFGLGWRLRAAVTAPWELAVSVSTPVTLWDGADSPGLEEEPASGAEPGRGVEPDSQAGVKADG